MGTILKSSNSEWEILTGELGPVSCYCFEEGEWNNVPSN
jgi:hypothetical protein